VKARSFSRRAPYFRDFDAIRSTSADRTMSSGRSGYVPCRDWLSCYNLARQRLVRQAAGSGPARPPVPRLVRRATMDSPRHF
jgi:hypothetical protein